MTEQVMDKDVPVPDARVYVVDDDPALCDSINWILESIAIQPVICHSADSFLDVYDGTNPACIVLDVRMPGISGTRLQDKINEFAPHVVIIFVSGHGDIRTSVSTLQKGAMDFLEKPYDPQRLLDAVQSGADRARTRFAGHVARVELREKLQGLTPRERQILALVLEGLPSRNIARRLGMSVKTVDVHRARIKSKTDSDSIGTFVRDLLRYDVEVPNEF
ncbi:response regulator [Rhodococcus sp. USK13]|uniref:response regulator transcription factor n=1 Tax=Rhodococcus sp. USK13 TaxID=2806442 RepID=UPI0020163BE7|nr:response regulator [Rhodococcus sp. USK13]